MLQPLSQLLIQHYLNDLSDLRRISGTARESVVREAFKTLLKDWGKARDLIFVPEYEYQTPQKTRVYPDGALLHALRVPLGYWEAKDEEDDIDAEIEKKFRKGYPQDNIVFDDSHEAVLIQNRHQVMRCGVENPAQLQKLLELFFEYERPEIADFRKAVDQFKADLPEVLKALREMIELAEHDNETFREASLRFLQHAQDTINPNVTAADVREMLIQHILTEEIFSQVFDDADFHHHNNVAKELYALGNTFFTGKVKHDTLAGLRPYYAAIKSAAALVTSHHEKQNFLKIIYETFYKIYDKKKADRLGVIYTPNEIVRFMVESADWLCQTHFGKSLIDKQVEILDPAAGTGTFITELIEHFRGQPAKLRHKYLEELHANEVAILPYYVANLNIEATYAAISGYEEYPNLCFVDTLDNLGWSRRRGSKGAIGDLFGAVSDENVKRIRRQNERKISVIIGNPPYNANQLNENENNKNRKYPAIDARIKDTYITGSRSQKTKRYDMYSRFFRWASDRIEDNGIVAFITNRNFIDSREADMFRKAVAEEYNAIYVLDLGGDVRDDPRLSGTKHNVFGIQTGVAISFMLRRSKASGCRILYARRPQLETAEEKLSFISTNAITKIKFDEIRPNAKHDWINLAETDFDSMVPLASQSTKSARTASQERAIFRHFSLGIATNRDEWAYDWDAQALGHKIDFFCKFFNTELARWKASGKAADVNDFVDKGIKWTSELTARLDAGKPLSFSMSHLDECQYRPFVLKSLYYDDVIVHRRYQQDKAFPPGVSHANKSIAFRCVSSNQLLASLAVARVFDLCLLKTGNGGTFGVSRWRFSENGQRMDNITDWGLEQFRNYYVGENKVGRPISKDAIFNYVYGVLNDPLYRETYALNLKREFPRIPFYADFWRWAGWGEKLMTLHIGYKTVEPWPLKRLDATDEKSRKAGLAPKTMLRASNDTGSIQIDSETQLAGVPPEAWAYRLGNRSALEWILDQYRERRPKDPTIREKFDTYRFAHHKETVIDLLKRVTRVSVETMKIVEAMRQLSR